MALLDRSDPKIDRLRQVPFFAEAPKKVLEHLASVTDEIQVAAGQTVITEGRRHHEAYVIQSGTAAVEIEGDVVAEAGEGEMIGELSMFLKGAASATVKAATDLSLIVIPYTAVDPILDENPAMVRAIAENLAARLRATDARHH